MTRELCASDVRRFAAAVGAEFHVVPVARPFLAPRKGAGAGGADFFGQVALVAPRAVGVALGHVSVELAGAFEHRQQDDFRAADLGGIGARHLALGQEQHCQLARFLVEIERDGFVRLIAMRQK